jgi:hypothetical protein
MLDLNKIEKDIDCFIANQTTESYNKLFKSIDEEEMVKLSGGYTVDFGCPVEVVVTKPNNMESGNCDFSEQEYYQAA